MLISLTAWCMFRSMESVAFTFSEHIGLRGVALPLTCSFTRNLSRVFWVLQWTYWSARLISLTAWCMFRSMESVAFTSSVALTCSFPQELESFSCVLSSAMILYMKIQQTKFNQLVNMVGNEYTVKQSVRILHENLIYFLRRVLSQHQRNLLQQSLFSWWCSQILHNPLQETERHRACGFVNQWILFLLFTNC